MRLHHVTLTTRHVHWSAREEVSPGVLDQLRPLVAECERHGVTELPTPDGLMTLRRIAPAEPSRHVAIWAVREPEGPALATIALAMRTRAGAGVWRQLHESARLELAHVGMKPMASAEPPPAPWLAAVLHLPSLLPQPHAALAWLGDLERCLAWAWIDEIWRKEDAGL